MGDNNRVNLFSAIFWIIFILLIRLVDKTDIFIVLFWGNHIPPEYSPVNQRVGTARCAVRSSQRDDPTLKFVNQPDKHNIYDITSVMMECGGLVFFAAFSPSQRLKGCA
jgi:hypothetical protein